MIKGSRLLQGILECRVVAEEKSFGSACPGLPAGIQESKIIKLGPARCRQEQLGAVRWSHLPATARIAAVKVSKGMIQYEKGP